MRQPHSSNVQSEGRKLLIRILRESASGLGANALQFRAANARFIPALNDLESSRLLKREDGRYFLTLMALRQLNVPETKQVMKDSQSIYAQLIKSYKMNPGGQVTVRALSECVALPADRIRNALSYMIEANWWSGRSTHLFAASEEETYVCPGEQVLLKKKWADWLREATSMHELGANRPPTPGTNWPDLKPSFPLASRVDSPSWLRSAPDQISAAFREVYRARDEKLTWLAAIGLRGIFEVMAAFVLPQQPETFSQQLEELRKAGEISEGESNVLLAVIEVGNAAAHRGHVPDSGDLSRLIDGVEHWARRLSEISPAAQRARGNAPPRKKIQPGPRNELDRA